MYAQVVQGGTTPEKRDEMNAIVREHAIPALKQEAGFAGALGLEDRVTGHGIVITFWETEEQAGATPTSSAFLEALGRVARISTGPRAPIGVWRVSAMAMDGATPEVR